MIKRVFLLAVLAALTFSGFAKANTSIYGTFSASYNYVGEDAGTKGMQGADNVSLFGAKGSWGDDDLKAFFNLQTGAPADGNGGQAFKQRFYFGGLEGGFGKVMFGRMTNAYKFPGFKMDPFYNLSTINVAGKYSPGAGTYGLSPATNGFTDNALQYYTPSFSGFKLLGGVYLDDTSEDAHSYLVGATYTAENFDLGGVFAMNGDTVAALPNIAVDGKAIRVYGNYKGDGFKLGASYENVDINGIDGVSYIYVTGTLMAKDIATDFSASVGSVSDGLAKGFGVTAGAFHNVVENAQLLAIISYASLDNDLSPVSFSVGFKYKFSIPMPTGDKK